MASRDKRTIPFYITQNRSERATKFFGLDNTPRSRYLIPKRIIEAGLLEFAGKGKIFLREERIGTDLQTEKPSIAKALNQAEALIESSRYPEAREKLQEISNNFQFPILSEPSYRFHYQRGLLLFRLGEQPAAWEEIEEALRIFKTVNARFSIPVSENLPDFIKDNLRQLRDVEIALLGGLQEPDGKENIDGKSALMERVSEISNLLENLGPLAKMHYYAGCIKMHLAKLDESMEHFERAATGFKLIRDWAALARTLNLISQVYHRKGQLGLCIQFNEQARTYCQKAGDRYTEMFLCHNLAYFHLTAGAWRPAIPLLSDLLSEIKKTKDYSKISSTLLTWGYANLLGGRLKECRKAYNESLRISTEQNLIGILKMAHGYFSELCLATGQLEEAENHLNKALEIAHRVTPGGSTETEAWRELGDVYLAQKRYERAKRAYAACAGFLEKLPDKLEEGAMYRSLGILHSRQGQFQIALHNFKKALDIFETCGNQWEKAKTFVIAAESGVFTKAELEPNIAWAKEVFKRLEHPAWIKRARALLKTVKNTGQAIPLPLAKKQIEREQIVKALLVCNGNISQTAKKLGLLRQTLQYKIRHYRIEV